MIKLLHLADLHIGIENYGRIDPETGLHTRLLDYLERLDEAIELGLNAGVHLVLIAGDIYKHRTPNPTHQREFARRMLKLQAAGVQVFIITGNHDISPALGRAHSVEIFRALDVPGITIADRPSIHELETPAGRLQLIALPWVNRHTLLTRDETRLLPMSEIDRMLRDRIDNFVAHALDDLDPRLPAVLLLHGTLDGAQVGAERNLTLGQDLVLSRGVVAQSQLDYVAMGHIHRHQSLGDYPPLVYAGSIERIDFGERQEDKGCVLVELERGNTRWQFHKLNARPFISLEIDVRTSSAPLDTIASAINRHDLQRAVVRVLIQATAEQAAALSDDAVRQLLETAQVFLVASISIDVERETRNRFLSAEQELLHGLSPRRALELYLQSKETAPERIAALLAAADELLSEEER